MKLALASLSGALALAPAASAAPPSLAHRVRTAAARAGFSGAAGKAAVQAGDALVVQQLGLPPRGSRDREGERRTLRPVPRPSHLETTSKVRAPGGGYGYGFGIRKGRPGDPPTIWHNGGAPGAAGELDINPKLGIVVVTLGNVSPPDVFPVVDAALHALRVP